MYICVDIFIQPPSTHNNSHNATLSSTHLTSTLCAYTSTLPVEGTSNNTRHDNQQQFYTQSQYSKLDQQTQQQQSNYVNPTQHTSTTASAQDVINDDNTLQQQIKLLEQRVMNNAHYMQQVIGLGYTNNTLQQQIHQLQQENDVINKNNLTLQFMLNDNITNYNQQISVKDQQCEAVNQLYQSAINDNNILTNKLDSVQHELNNLQADYTALYLEHQQCNDNQSEMTHTSQLIRLKQKYASKKQQYNELAEQYDTLHGNSVHYLQQFSLYKQEYYKVKKQLNRNINNTSDNTALFELIQKNDALQREIDSLITQLIEKNQVILQLQHNQQSMI